MIKHRQGGVKIKYTNRVSRSLNGGGGSLKDEELGIFGLYGAKSVQHLFFYFFTFFLYFSPLSLYI